jgi:small subunit ribosomal protein S1
MDALLEESDYELEAPRRGEIRTGTVARVTETDVFIDIGAKSEGVIPQRELEQLTPEQRSELRVGKEVSVYVVRPGARGGSMELSLARAEEEQDWQRAEELMRSKEIFEGEVAGYNKGGLIVRLGQLRGFIPASQVSLARRRRAEGDTPDKRWGKMVGEHVMSKVIEVDRRRNRLILSERSAARESREALKERLIEQLRPGEVRSGHVISLADFGAFVDIGGADGLVHISEISWKRVSDPREVLKVGQEVKVKVLSVDRERHRISLSLRDLEPNPWERIKSEFRQGQLVEGVITKLTKFGAFARLKALEDFGIEGLIHISELSDRRIEHPREAVQEGDVLTLRVLNVDEERRRIGLSLRRVASEEYAESDWRAAQRVEAEPETDEETDEAVADFDAELEAEAAMGEGAEELDEGAAPETRAEGEAGSEDRDEPRPDPVEPVPEGGPGAKRSQDRAPE